MTRYYYDAQNVVLETDADEAPRRSFVHGSQYVDERVLLRLPNGAEYYYLPRELYSVAALTDESGTIVEAATYDTYGQVAVYDDSAQAVDDSPVGNPYYFTGRRLDLLPTASSPQPSAKQMYHYRARAYDPGDGRFMQRDPAGYVDGLGLYEYVTCNPAVYTDAKGEQVHGVAKGTEAAESICGSGWVPDSGWDVAGATTTPWELKSSREYHHDWTDYREDKGFMYYWWHGGKPPVHRWWSLVEVYERGKTSWEVAGPVTLAGCGQRIKATYTWMITYSETKSATGKVEIKIKDVVAVGGEGGKSWQKGTRSAGSMEIELNACDYAKKAIPVAERVQVQRKKVEQLNKDVRPSPAPPSDSENGNVIDQYYTGAKAIVTCRKEEPCTKKK